MKNLINADFIERKERLKGLGCRRVSAIKMYESKYKEINQKKRLIKMIIKKV